MYSHIIRNIYIFLYAFGLCTFGRNEHIIVLKSYASLIRIMKKITTKKQNVFCSVFESFSWSWIWFMNLWAREKLVIESLFLGDSTLTLTE